MVKNPNFKITANGNDITKILKENQVSISFKDEANSKADELTLTVIDGFARPKYEDELELYLGYDNELSFCGSFKVQSTTRTKNNTLSISATGVDFSNSLKEKRDITYEHISVKDICSQIAKRNNLELKSDYDDIIFQSLAQSNESDLHFLNRLAKEMNSIFNIKNNTLIFTKKIKENKKNEELPAYLISADECTSLSIKHSNKTLYKSCKSIWHDTKENKTKTVIAGSGEPSLLNKSTFKNEAEALIKATAKLEKANQGIVSGSLAKDGEIIFAGGKLNLIDTFEDDGEYQIKSVSHEFSDSWEIKLEFER